MRGPRGTLQIPGRFRACLIQTSPKPTRNFDSLEPYPDLDEGGPEPVRPDTDAPEESCPTPSWNEDGPDTDLASKRHLKRSATDRRARASTSTAITAWRTCAVRCRNACVLCATKKGAGLASKQEAAQKQPSLCSYVALSRARARQSPCTMRGTSRCGCGEKVCLIEVSVCRVVGDSRGIRAGSARDPRGIRGQNAGSVALGYAKTEAFRGIRRIRIPLL